MDEYTKLQHFDCVRCSCLLCFHILGSGTLGLENEAEWPAYFDISFSLFLFRSTRASVEGPLCTYCGFTALHRLQEVQDDGCIWRRKPWRGPHGRQADCLQTQVGGSVVLRTKALKGFSMYCLAHDLEKDEKIYAGVLRSAAWSTAPSMWGHKPYPQQ